MERDQIDEFLDEISTELPRLDLVTEGIVDRISFLDKHLKRAMEETLSERGLTHGEWSVLGILKRPGPPYRRTPGQLARHADLSTGAMTNRLDKLEEAGLVRRLPDPDDRRSVQVELTEAGHRAWEESVDVQARKEALLVSALTGAERDQLNELLRRVVVKAERELGPIKRGKDRE
jgi:DNA-binding MarR family transcriptional regulator